MKTAFISEQGLRHSMEDAHYLNSNLDNRGWLYCGIYDGHNGDFAARYSAKNLHCAFLKGLTAGLSPDQALVSSYEKISCDIQNQESGATAVDCVILDQQILTANVGDARAIVVNRSGASQLTVDHRIDNVEERERLVRMGADISYPYVMRGYRGLMPTRSIGDQYFKEVGVIATPYVSDYLVSPGDLYLILACDGLWDFMTNVEVAAAARQYSDPETLLKALRHEVLVNRSGTDNLTVIAVGLSPQAYGPGC